MTKPFKWIERSVAQASSDSIVDLIRGLVDINSGSTNLAGVRRVQDELAKLMRPLGTVSFSEAAPVSGIDLKGRSVEVSNAGSLHLTIRPEAKRRLLVMGHADTVFSADNDFRTSWVDGERLRGPGAADMKGGLVLFLKALELVEKYEVAPGLGIDFMVSGDEETGSLGSAPRIDELARLASYGLALEPCMADGSMSRARHGSANLTLVVSGRSAHAGRALADGRNAVLAAAEMGLVAEALGANVASITGGEQFNSVPDSCVVRINRRGPDAAEIESMIAALDREARRVESEREVTIVRHGRQHRPAKAWTSESEALADLARGVAEGVGRTLSFVDTGGCATETICPATGSGFSTR